MSNARIRKYLEGLSAPILAWLLDNGYVYDDCGILNAYRTSISQGVQLAHHNMIRQVPVPAMRAPRERL